MNCWWGSLTTRGKLLVGILTFSLAKFPSRSWMMWTWRTKFFRRM